MIKLLQIIGVLTFGVGFALNILLRQYGINDDIALMYFSYMPMLLGGSVVLIGYLVSSIDKKKEDDIE